MTYTIFIFIPLLLPSLSLSEVHTVGESLTYKLKEWKRLLNDIEDFHSEENPNSACDVDADLTHAYILLADLFYQHPNGVAAWALPRRDFYENEFNKLMNVKFRLCHFGYKSSPKLVCHEKRCVKCENLPIDGDAKLKEACSFNGTGGRDKVATKSTNVVIQYPKSPRIQMSERCRGWLTEQIARKIYNETAKMYSEGVPDDVFGPHVQLKECDYLPEIEVAFAYAKQLAGPGPQQSRIQQRIEENRGFWEEKLHPFKEGKWNSFQLCSPWPVRFAYSHEESHYGPFACGRDQMCVDCKDITKDMVEIYEACNPQSPTTPPKLENVKACGMDDIRILQDSIVQSDSLVSDNNAREPVEVTSTTQRQSQNMCSSSHFGKPQIILVFCGWKISFIMF